MPSEQTNPKGNVVLDVWKNRRHMNLKNGWTS